MKVLKFGGLSLANTDRIKESAKIISDHDSEAVVIISAFQGVSSDLTHICEHIRKNEAQYKNVFNGLLDKHYGIVYDLFGDQHPVLNEVKNLFLELSGKLEEVRIAKNITPAQFDDILSYGEIISSKIVHAYLNDAHWLDAREVIKTDANFGFPTVDILLSKELIEKSIQSKTTIVPGFIASTTDGATIVLHQGGSEHSAAIFAAAMDAEMLEIWTNVDGFMTADPTKVEKAISIVEMNYAEAIELSHFGARVLNPPVFRSLIPKRIPIKIKNSTNPDAEGTLIHEAAAKSSDLITGISSVDQVDLLTVHGAGMAGVSGTYKRMSTALASCNVSVILITQASSEASITFAVNPLDTQKSVDAIRFEFNEAISSGVIKVDVEKDLSIIAVVGENMRNKPGIAANLFSSLGRNGVNIAAIAQGSSEVNISVVIRREELKKALNVLHEGFFLSNHKELHLFIIGLGTVGGSLLKQIQQQQDNLMNNHNLKINVVGLARTKKMLIRELGIDLDNYLDQIDQEGVDTNLKQFVARSNQLNLRNSVFVDCTADALVADLYEDVLANYTSVVTANKIASSSSYDRYLGLKSLAQEKNVKYLFETNVGAGLPILSTIGDLTKSGDKIIKMEAVLSGTLNYIFNVLSEEVSLSEAIKQSKELGFSEPDPRIDLSGIDVVRKMLILCREAGYKVEQEDVDVNKFLPDDCFEGDLDSFWDKVSSFDEKFEEDRKQLEKDGKKWRFVALFDDGKQKVQLQEVDQSHPAYNLDGSNNIILIYTERYNEAPMVIKGYGAGADVTAAGVFADIIRVANV